MHDYVRHLVASVAAQALPANGSSFRAAIARQFLPYCVHKIAGDGRYILLSREHKPLGWPTRRKGFVDYSDAMFESVKVSLSELALADLPRAASEHGEFVYLYGKDDSPAPWVDDDAAMRYIGRLCLVLGIASCSREGASL